MNILVLGSEGQIGKPLVVALRKQGHIVKGWDKKNSYSENIGNLLNTNNLINDCLWADKVFFLAFEVGGSKFLENVDKDYSYIEKNVILMEQTFLALRQSDTPFIFTSSQMSNMHHTNYGFLKDLGERYTRSLDNGWICRFWNVFGVEDCEDEKKHVITDFIEESKTGVINMRTTGEEERQFLHVDDCTDALIQWVDNVWDNQEEYYDITSFQWCSIFDVASYVAYLRGGCEIVIGDKTDKVQLGIRNKPSEYIKQFWTPKISIKEGIHKVYDNIQ